MKVIGSFDEDLSPRIVIALAGEQVRIHWFEEERALQAIVTEAEDGLIGTEMLFGLTLFIDIDENQVVLESKANPHTEAANRPT